MQLEFYAEGAAHRPQGLDHICGQVAHDIFEKTTILACYVR